MTSSHSTNSTPTQRKRHILVVEDEQHLAVGIRYNLQAEGYQVTTVDNGADALKRITESPDEIDLIILDLMLPGMSGYRVCQTLREIGNDRPVLILSARTLTEDRTRGFEAGADQYLNKPFDLDELLTRVKSLLTMYDKRVRRRGAGPDQPAPDLYQFAKANIDVRTYEVTVDGQPVRLTQLEMKLLQYFIENEGRVIPRHELLENVWGTSGEVATRTVDQFIVRLRKAFEENPSEPKHFLTLRDAGYRFVANPTNGTTA
jgi:two-component system OmpR family response regulator